MDRFTPRMTSDGPLHGAGRALATDGTSAEPERALNGVAIEAELRRADRGADAGIEPARSRTLPATSKAGELESGLMGEALIEARTAARKGEVPVGAIVFHEGRIVGRGSNRPIAGCDPTAHAEILAIREAASQIGNYRLPGAVLVVTLEPCLMCFGAALHARLARVIFGALDPRIGAADLIMRLQSTPGALNHRLVIDGGIHEEECASLLRSFFAARR